MRRHLDDDNFEKFQKDFDFLFKIVRASKGELDLRLRDNYFSLYYRGNSLAKVDFKKDRYEISIHEKFLGHDKGRDIFKDDKRFFNKGNNIGNYKVYSLTPELLHPFFQIRNLNRLFSKIRGVNHSEELTLEQMIITDNMEQNEWYIIDRQVTESSFRNRIDLLALKQLNGKEYQFIVIEVKLGNNPDLNGKVVDQLSKYVNHINDHFENWKQSYEKYFKQIKKTKIFEFPSFDSIEITKGAEGIIVVGGYSVIASEKVEKITSSNPEIEIKQFKNQL